MKNFYHIQYPIRCYVFIWFVSLDILRSIYDEKCVQIYIYSLTFKIFINTIRIKQQQQQQ